VHLGLAALTLFPGRVGGSETYVRGLLGRFAAGEGPERVDVLANRHVAAAYGEYARGPVRLCPMRSYRAGDRLASRALAMAAARLAPRRAARDAPAGLDLVHYAVTVPIPRLALPAVVTVHDVSHLDRRGPASWPLRAYRRWAYDGAARRADAVVATSPFARRRIVEGMGVAAERVEVIAPGIDHDTFSPEADGGDEARLAGLGLPERFLLYPANLWPHKNHERLLGALAAADGDLALVLAGQEYGGGARLRAAAERAGVGGRVHHVGQRDPATLAALYRRAHATVIPSLHEGFGFPALEAMACGCPVATSGRGALADLPEAAALRFDPEDPAAIAAAVERIDSRRRDLVAAGREHAAGFTWARCARRHVEVYARVVTEPR
jgi:glycosyltransferase involved in cell wall biosynthesis